MPTYAQNPPVTSIVQSTPAQATSAKVENAATDSPTVSPPVAAGQQIVGHVVWVKGDFKAETADKKQRNLQRDSVIYLHDTLFTGDKSQAQVVFTDNSLMAFHPKTTFQIKEYHFNSAKPSDASNKYGMNLVTGGFRTVTGWVGKTQPKNYKIQTPVATIGVRGTDFSVFYDPNSNRKLQVQLKVGSIDITNGGGVTELNAQTKQFYAEVNNAAQVATVVSVPPVVFQRDPTIIPAISAGTPVVPAVSATMKQPENNTSAQPPVSGGANGGDTSGGVGGAAATGGTSGGEEAAAAEGDKGKKGDETAAGSDNGSTGGGEGTTASSSDKGGTGGDAGAPAGGDKGGTGGGSAGAAPTGGTGTTTSTTTGTSTGTSSGMSIGTPSAGAAMSAPTAVGTPAPTKSVIPTTPKGPVDSFCIQ